MKVNQYIVLLMVMASAILYACKKEHDFLRDNTNTTGVGYAPICTNTLSDVTNIKSLGSSANTATAYAAGATFNTELQYISESPVKEINQYNTIGAGTRTKTGTWPYAKAFSSLKKVDTMLVPYTVPTTTAGTVIKLEYEILNQNNLNVVRTVYVKLQ